MADVKGFPLNFKNIYSINTTPGEEEDTFAVVAKGVENVDPEFEDEVDDTVYYDGQGFGNDDVTGIKASLVFSGHRNYDDEAQNYVAGMAFEVGEGRKTTFKWEQANGTTVTGPVTVSEIKVTGGDANEKSEFSFSVTFNGKPEVVAAT